MAEEAALIYFNNINKSEKIEDILDTFLNNSFIEDGNIIGYFDEPDIFPKLVERMKEKGFTYSVRDSDVRKKSKATPGDGGDNLENNFSQTTVFYQLKAMSIKFFGLPFTIEKTTHYQCSYGQKYYKSRAGVTKSTPGEISSSLPVKKRRNISSKKMGCLAKMTLKKIAVYPEYSLEIESDWRKKKKKIECLRKDLSDDNKNVESFFRYYLSVSLQSSHNHPPILPHNSPKGKKYQTLSCRKSPKESEDAGAEPVAWDPTFKDSDLEDPEDDPDETEERPVELRQDVTLDEPNFLSTFVKFPASNYEITELRPIAIGLEINGFPNQEEPRMFQIQTIQYHPAPQIQTIQYHPSPQDMQMVFREKLKRLYTISESCFNSALLLRLVSELDQVELAMQNDIACSPSNNVI